jgi:hypothetical protein
MPVERFGLSGSSSRHLVLVRVPRFDAVEADFAVPSKHFVAVVLGDATRPTDGDLHRFAISVLAQGAVYVVVAGPRSRRLEDVFDDAIVFAESHEGPDGSVRFSTESNVVITTSHGDDVDGALEFGMADAHPSSDYEETCRAIVVFVVGEGVDVDYVREVLGEPEHFLARMRAGE